MESSKCLLIVVLFIHQRTIISQEEAQWELSGYVAIRFPRLCRMEDEKLNMRQIPPLLELLFPFYSRCYLKHRQLPTCSPDYLAKMPEELNSLLKRIETTQ